MVDLSSGIKNFLMYINSSLFEVSGFLCDA